jgi:ABC-type phosphate transport system substrate-binding protein
MRKSVLRAMFGASIAVGLVVSGSGVASAAPDTSRVSQTIVGVGSDTTYEAMNRLDLLYNESAGCAIIPSSGTFANYEQKCIIGGALSYDGALIETENEYHDRVIEAYPVGSGNGASVLFQYTNGAAAVPGDFSRSSSKRTLTAVAGFTQYESSYARDGISYWIGKNNTNVTQNGAGTLPTPNISQADLKKVYFGDGNPNTSNTGCATNWLAQPNGTSLANTDSVGNATGAPGSGSIVVYATQAGSGTGKDFANFLQGGAVAADLQKCIDPNFTDGTGEQHVIFENNATPICGDGHRPDAIFPYSFARFTQNAGGSGSCAGVLGAIGNKKPTLNSIAKLASAGGFPFGRYVYNYFYVPNTVDPTVPSSWGNDVSAQAVLSYLDAKNGWLCNNTHSNDPFPGASFGKSYRTLITDTLTKNGFAPLTLGATGAPYGLATSFCRTNAAT